MEEKNLLEKLVDMSPGMEIWWDSSPVIFNNWCRKMLDKAAPEDKEIMQGQFDRMFDENDPEKCKVPCVSLPSIVLLHHLE